jgi:Ras-related GTP-binding protein C/D
MDFQIWDVPGQLEFSDPAFDSDTIFGQIGALIWVVDCQDEHHEAIGRLCATVIQIHPRFPDINIEIFIHKTDGVSDDYVKDYEGDVSRRVSDELADAGYDNAPLHYHRTSIYDHTIFEAFSKVIQRLVPSLPIFERMLNDLCVYCGFEKIYLFDVLSKIHVATDASPNDMSSYEICADFIDVVIDLSDIYAWDRPADVHRALEGPPYGQPLDDQMASPDAEAMILLKEGHRPVMLKEVNKYLCLVAIMKEGSLAKYPQIQQNVEKAARGLTEIFRITKTQRPD